MKTLTSKLSALKQSAITKVKGIVNKYYGKRTIDENYVPSWIEMYNFYFSYIQINWFIIILNNLKMLLSSFISVRQPFLILDIKSALIDMDDTKLALSILEFIVYKIILKLFQYIDQSFNNQNYSQVQQTIQLQILEHIFGMDISYFENNKVSEISDLIQNSSSYICSDVLYNSFIQDVTVYLQYGGQLYFIFIQSPKILFTMMVISLIGAVFKDYLTEKIRKEQKALDEDSTFKSFVLSDILNNIFLIKTFGTEKKEIDLMNKINTESEVRNKRINFLNDIQNLSQNVLNQALSVVVLVQIFMLKVQFPDSTKDIAVALAEMMSYSYATLHVSSSLITFIKKKPEASDNTQAKSVGKIMYLLNQKPKIPQDINNTGDKSQFQGNIRFENVFFKYPKTRDTLSIKNQELHKKKDNSDVTKAESTETSKNTEILDETKDLLLTKQESEQDYVLKNISFNVKQGQFVAFVGMSGSGKSTIVKMIQRYYDSDSGFIFFDDQNVKDVSVSKLRRSIGIVSQEPTLFDNDIEFNITYGVSEADYTQEELRHICDVSGVSEFVFDEKRFPQGLKTLVGTKGIKLSGGQKQRVAIARALIKKPSILILDEATSSLDAESEHIVQKYIDQLVDNRGMTIVVVAHRLSTIIKSDVIYVMEHGQIKEQGNHTQLLQSDGVYKKLIHHQINFSEQIEIN